jgi:hypothetical protein
MQKIDSSVSIDYRCTVITYPHTYSHDRSGKTSSLGGQIRMQPQMSLIHKTIS